MLPKHWVKWLATLALAAAGLLTNADATRADVWSLPNDCGCGDQPPAAGWTLPCITVPTIDLCLTRPFWQRPTPPYHSSWQRVPVTNYRPQVVNDPLTGVSTTAVQPCDTHEWQLRRTPGCSLWQNFADWWRSNCCFLHPPSTSPGTADCPPEGQWVVTSPESSESPYYAPSSNGRLVPVPSSAAPTSPVPADRRPQLNPVTPRPVEGSASRSSPPDTEILDTKIFVRTLEASTSSLELGPPLVAPGLRAANEEAVEDLEYAPTLPVADPDDRTAATDESSLELIPVSWSTATPSREHTLPTDEVWDDTGWRSEQ